MWLPRPRERARESTRNKSLTGMMGCGPKLSQTGHLSATRTSQLKACLAWLPALLAPPQHLVLHLEPQDQLPRLGVGGEGNMGWELGKRRNSKQLRGDTGPEQQFAG